MNKNVIETLQRTLPSQEDMRRCLDELLQSGNPEAMGKFIEAEAIVAMADILESEELREEIQAGNVTLAMVKPRLDEAVDLAGREDESFAADDAALAQQLESEIAPPLEVVFSISLNLTQEMIDEFYDGAPKANQLRVPPIDETRYGINHPHRWSEFEALMHRGPVTYLVLHSEDSQAIRHWRTQMGDNWNVEKVKIEYPDSLRARYARDSHNNLLHGSDSPESALREIQMLASFMRQSASVEAVSV